MRFVDPKRGVDVARDVTKLVQFGFRRSAGRLGIGRRRRHRRRRFLETAPAGPATFAPLPPAAAKAASYGTWQKEFARWLQQDQVLSIFFDAATGLTSQPEETEAAFRARVNLTDREARDAEKERLRQKFAPKVATLTERIRRAEQAKQVQEQQASDAKLQTGISVLGTIAGALFGRKAVSIGTLGKATTAARGMGRSMRESSDVGRANETLETYKAQLQELEHDIEAEIAGLEAGARAAEPGVHGDRDPAQEDACHPGARRPRSGGRRALQHRRLGGPLSRRRKYAVSASCSEHAPSALRVEIGRWPSPPPSTSRSAATRPARPSARRSRRGSTRWRSERIDIPIIIGGKEIRTGEIATVVMPHDHRHVLGRLPQGDAGARRAGDRAPPRARSASGRTGRGRIAPRCSSRPPSCSPTTWRADAQRRDDARPVEDGVPGRDRRGVRADRLLALQRRATRRSSTTSSRSANDTMWNQLDYRAARGIRLRGDAVQLHVDRRQPADRAGADGQHGDLEAGVDARCSSAYYIMKLLEEAGLPPGVINFVPGDPRDDLERRCSRTAISPACTSPAAPTSSTACGRRSARTCRDYRAYPRIVGETGGKDFIVAHPSADPAGARRRDRARRLRVPGTEVLGGEPRLRPAVALARGARSHRRDDRRDQDGRRPRLPQLHGRGDRRERVRRRSATTSTTRETNATIVAGGKCRRRRRATSSSRRSSRPNDPAYRLLCEEIFGPVVTALRLRRRASGSETLRVVDATSPYALTGAVFAHDRARHRARR